MDAIKHYPLPLADNTISIPEGAEPLSVEVQNGITVMYARVNTEEPLETRRFMVFQTDAPMPRNLGLTYIGSFRYKEVVFHTFWT